MSQFSMHDWYGYLKFINVREFNSIDAIELRFIEDNSKMPCGCTLNIDEAEKLIKILSTWIESKKNQKKEE